MDKIRYLSNYGRIEKKDKRYYLFKAFLLFLSKEEITQLLNKDFSQGILTRFLITQRVLNDIKTGFDKYYEEMVEEIFKEITTLPTYHKKQAASKFLTEISEFLPKEYQESLISYLFNSPYVNDRKRAYYLLDKNFNDSYTEKLFNHLRTYDDNYPLSVIVNNCSGKILSRNFELINKYFADEFIEYDWQLLKIRTKFYSRIYKRRPQFIRELEFKDPISYMYVMKEAGEKVNPDIAWSVYKANPARYSLFRLFSDLKLWEVLVRINKYQKAH